MGFREPFTPTGRMSTSHRDRSTTMCWTGAAHPVWGYDKAAPVEWKAPTIIDARRRGNNYTLFWLEQEWVVSEDSVVQYNHRFLQRQNQHWAPDSPPSPRAENEAGIIRGASGPSSALHPQKQNHASPLGIIRGEQSLPRHENTDLFCSLVKFQTGVISIEENTGTFLIVV
jgi:hypothetical protein